MIKNKKVKKVGKKSKPVNSKNKSKHAAKRKQEEVFVFDLFGDHFLTFIPESGAKRSEKKSKSTATKKMASKKKRKS